MNLAANRRRGADARVSQCLLYSFEFNWPATLRSMGMEPRCGRRRESAHILGAAPTNLSVGIIRNHQLDELNPKRCGTRSVWWTDVLKRFERFCGDGAAWQPGPLKVAPSRKMVRNEAEVTYAPLLNLLCAPDCASAPGALDFSLLATCD